MKVKDALKHYRRYLQMECSVNTYKKFDYSFRCFEKDFSEREVESITEEEMIDFLMDMTEGNDASTKNSRLQEMMAFFNNAKNSFKLRFENPCCGYRIKLYFRAPKSNPKRIPDRYKIEEMMIKEEDLMNKTIFELMGVGCMRVSEVLGLRVDDVLDRKLLLQKPKSKRKNETVMLPARLHQQVIDFIRDQDLQPGDKVFPVSYSSVHRRLKKAATHVGIKVSPHDLRRSSATYLIRRGVPIDIVSRVYLRHGSIQITERYIMHAKEDEAQRWLDTIHG